MNGIKNLCIVAVVVFFALLLPAIADWDKDKPADNRDYDLRDNDIRTNNAALETAFSNEHEFYTDGVQTGEPNEGHAKAYYESAAPTLRPDGSTSLDANDAGRLWYDLDVNTLYVYSGNEWESFVDSTIYDVRAYGATGDGSTDDSTAFQAAIDAAYNSAVGGTVLVPAGTYILDTALVPKSYVTVKGVNRSACILKASAVNNDGIFVATPADSLNHFRLERLSFRSVDKDVSALENKSTTKYFAYFYVHDCDFWAEFDITIKGLFGHCRFVECWFGYRGTAPTDYQAVSLVGTAGGVIFSNRFEQCGFYKGSATQEAMVNLETGYVQTFDNCIFETAYCPAIHAEGVMGVHLINGTNIENLDCTSAAQNCVIYLEQDSVLTQGSSVIVDSIKVSNGGHGGSAGWDALVYTGSSCTAQVFRVVGSLSSYLTYDGTNYDTTRLLRWGRETAIAYSGTLPYFGFNHKVKFGDAIQMEGGGSARQETLIYTIDVDDDASTDDYQFDDDAANANEQVITITDAIPAYAELVSCQLRCFETVTGSTAMSIDIGTSSGGAEIHTAANTDSANDINTTAAGDAPELAATNAARSVYVNATPGANWNTLDAGRWAIMLTFIDYGGCYSDN